MTVKIIKPTIESGEPAFLASIDGEAPEIYSEKLLDKYKVQNIEFIYEAPPAGIQERQINALAELFGGMLRSKKSA
jgi:hypothetical protein